MTHSRILAAAALLPLFAACDVVLSTDPVGREPMAIEAEEWQGTWTADDGAFTVSVPEGDPGRVELAWIEEEDGRPVLKTTPVHLRSAGEWVFASLANEEESGSGPPGSGPPGSGQPESGRPQEVRYLWGRLAKDGDRILFWLPRAEKFQQLVEEGVLPGTVEEGGDVVLGKLEARHLALIASEERGVLFEWEAPMILRRLDG